MKAEVWLTTGEAAELAGISRQAAHKKVLSGDWESRQEKIAAGGGRGGIGYLVALSSLPTPARQKYLRLNKAAPRLELAGKPSEVPTPTVSESVEPEPSGGVPGGGQGYPVNLAEVKALVGQKKFDEMMAEAERKAEAVREALDLPESRQKTQQLAEIAERKGLTLSTLYRYMDSYKEGGTAALMRRLPRLGVGTVRRSITDKQAVFIRAEFLQLSKPKAAQVYNKLNRYFKKIGLECCSKSTFFRFIEDLERYEPDLVCLARKGEEEYMKKYAIKATRKEPDFVNEVWEGDHHRLDAFIKYQGRALRPWVTIWIDVSSRVIVGFTISAQANGRTIALATRHAILPKVSIGWDQPISKAMVKALNGLGWDPEEMKECTGEKLPYYGLPKTLYIDNGEDYRSKLKKDKKHEGWEYSREMRSTCELLNIQALFCTAYSPWAKGHAERWFGTFTSQFTRYLPGFCGSDNKDRPADLDEKAMAERGDLLDLEELCKLIEMYLEIYHNTVHSSLGMTPAEKYIATPKVREEMPDVRAMDICLMDVERAKVTPSGIAKFGSMGKRRWYKHQALDALVGQWAIIRYDPNRIGQILVFSARTGEYICTATNGELMAWGASKDDVKQFSRRRATNKKALKARLKDVKTDLSDMVAEREEAGAVMVTGRNIPAKPEMHLITGMEKAARDREKEAKSPPRRQPPKTQSVFDRHIIEAGK